MNENTRKTTARLFVQENLSEEFSEKLKLLENSQKRQTESE